MEISGISLVNRIDEVISELGITRKDFAEKINVIPTTMATWKTRDIFPPVDTISKIADELEVSLDWLIAGYSGWGVEQEYFGEDSREAVRTRIYKLLTGKDGLTEDEMQTAHIITFPVTYQALKNWAKGRISLDLYFFHQMAYKLNTNIQYLLTGLDDKLPKDFDPELFKNARENAKILNNLNTLSEDKKNIVSDIVFKLVELEHFEHISKD